VNDSNRDSSEQFVMKRTEGGRYESRRVEVRLAELIVGAEPQQALVVRAITYGLPASALTENAVDPDIIAATIARCRKVRDDNQ
jgi:hypothetical protein